MTSDSDNVKCELALVSNIAKNLKDADKGNNECLTLEQTAASDHNLTDKEKQKSKRNGFTHFKCFSMVKNRGLLLAALSSFVFATCSVIAKDLSDVHPIAMSFYGFLSITIISGLCLLRGSAGWLPKSGYIRIMVRSLCGCIFFATSFFAVSVMPLGDASVLFYTAPVWTIALASWLLKEPCSIIRDTIVVIIVILGVGMVTQPSFKTTVNANTHYVAGAIAALFASFAEALGNIALRELRNVPPLLVLFHYGIFSSLITGVTSQCLGAFAPVSKHELLLIIALSILTTLEQYLMVLALGSHHAGPVSLIQATDIVYGYIFEVIFYDEKLNAISLCGALVIAMAVIFIATRKSKSTTVSQV